MMIFISQYMYFFGSEIKSVWESLVETPFCSYQLITDMLENSQAHQHWWLCDVAQCRCKRVGPLLAAVYEMIYDNFFTIFLQTIMTVPELRYPAYQAVTDRILNQEQIVNSITSIKWDIKDIMSQHNGYVDIILRVSIQILICLCWQVLPYI